MNSKASETLNDNVIFLILLVLAGIISLLFIYTQMNGANIWSEYYAKEIAKTIDLAQPGDKFSLDIHKGTQIALRNDIPLEETFKFNNEKKEICVKLSKGKSTCYYYFKDLNVTNVRIDYGDPINLLEFSIPKIIPPENENPEGLI